MTAATDPTPADRLETSIDADHTVRLIREPTHFTAVPEIVDGEASGTGKTVTVSPDTGDHNGGLEESHRLDADEMDELERGGVVYRDSWHYRLFTPERMVSRCESQKQSNPMKYRADVPTVADIRTTARTTHAPEGSRFGPGGDDAPDEWDAHPAAGDDAAADADGANGAQPVATDGGTDATAADVPAPEHDLTAWNDGIESSADRAYGSAYVAQVVGEHRKYGVDREFLSEKHDGGARSLPVQRIDINDVVEVQHCDADPERTYQYIDGMTVEDGNLVDIETTVLDGQDEAIEALDWTGSGERQQLMDEIESQLGALDTGELRTVARQVGAEGDAGDPAEKATVHPADLPDDVRTEVTRMRKAFRTAYQDHLGVSPDEDTRAALIDAALLVEKQRRD